VKQVEIGPADSVQKVWRNDVVRNGGGDVHKYNVSVEIGSSGIGQGDDIRTTTFTVMGLTTADFTSNTEFGVGLLDPKEKGSCCLDFRIQCSIEVAVFCVFYDFMVYTRRWWWVCDLYFTETMQVARHVPTYADFVEGLY
jgi:hypothetical protein